jgi:tRNA dimethylallyltransferase
MEAARQLGVEIVSVDSMQVYRGMDIGTAKPTSAERAEVRHHLIDVVEPSELFTVARFQTEHAAVLDDLARRDVDAMYVGGTGLYLAAVVDGLTPPGEWPDIRAALEAECAEIGPADLHARLTELDPLAASRMEPTNARRVVRALEVCVGSGRPFSSFGPGMGAHPPTPVTQIALRWPRPILGERIARRVHQMFDDGLVAEVERLLAAPGGLGRTARQALGYKEVVAHLEGEMSLEEACDEIVLRTRQFAVRQERWFMRDPRVQWVEIESDPVAEALAAVTETVTRHI